jgi:hypothetical protein
MPPKRLRWPPIEILISTVLRATRCLFADEKLLAIAPRGEK